jgi:uncharacterized transporter YbjL
MKNLALSILFCLISLSTYADNMSDIFIRSGKYYVVVAVLAIIFTVIIAYLIRIDLKLRKLEEDHKS